MADSKQLTKNSMVWKKGMEQWEKAGDVDENGEIEFRNVQFKYNELSEEPDLTHINFTIKSGETILC